MSAADVLDNCGNADTVRLCQNWLPTDTLFSMLTNVIEDTGGRNRNDSVEFCLRGERAPLVVIRDDEGREAAGHIHIARRDSFGGSGSVFKPGGSIGGELELRIVGTIAQNRLRAALQRQGDAGA